MNPTKRDMGFLNREDRRYGDAAVRVRTPYKRPSKQVTFENQENDYDDTEPTEQQAE